MRAIDVVNELYSRLPHFTDNFTDNFDITSLTRSGDIATAITTTAHGLNAAETNYAFVDGARNPIVISSLTQAKGIAIAETAEDHDLTFSDDEFRLGQFYYVEISGVNEAEYNGSHKILGVPDRTHFEYEIDSSAPSPATGSPLLLQSGVGYNGWHEVIDIPDTTTFTYTIDPNYEPNSPAVGTIRAKLRPRISRAVQAEEAISAYTKKNTDELWAFVVIGNRVANKDRHVISDATATPGRGDEYRQKMIQPFSIFTIFPAISEIAAGKERDNADDLTKAFLKSTLRIRFPTGFEEEPYSGTVFSGDRFFLYNKAVYVHEYAFETTAWITYGDTTDPEHSVALKKIDLTFDWTIGNGEPMTAEIDL